MNKLFLIFLSIFLASCLHITQQNIPKCVKPSTTHIDIYIDEEQVGLCSAVAVERHFLLTANHCCNKDVELRLGDLPAIPVAQDKKIDACLLYVEKHSLQPVKIATQNPQYGDRITIVGFPLGMPYFIAEGRFVGIEDGLAVYSVPTFFGFSGSGIFNENGELVGLTSMVVPSYFQMTFSPTRKALIEFIVRGIK